MNLENAPSRLASWCYGLVLSALLLWPTASTAQNAYIPNANNTISVIDTTAGTLVKTIAPPAASEPAGVAVTPDGSKIYVTNQLGNSVSVIATETGAVLKTIPVGSQPKAIVITSDGGKVYVANTDGNQPYSANGSMSVIDTSTDSVVATLTLFDQDSPTNLALSPDGSTLFVTSEGDSASTYVFNAQTGQPLSNYYLPGAGVAVDISADGKSIYIAKFPDGPLAGLPNAGLPYHAAIRAVRASPDGHRLYVAGYIEFQDYLWALDTASGAMVWSAKLAGASTGLDVTADSSKVYVPTSSEAGGRDGLAVIDAATGSVAVIPVGPQPLAYGRFLATAPSPLAAAVLPGARTVAWGRTATVFATLINGGTAPASGCGISLPASAPSALSLSYQTTDPATNAVTGMPNTPVTIPGGGAQSFVLSLTASAATTALGQTLDFSCGGLRPAPVTLGVNTVDLGFSASSTADIVALAATAPQPGVVTIPYSSGGGAAFSVATDNLGAEETLTVTADTGGASLPLSISLCPTDPTSGACLQPAASSIEQNFPANATPTFSVFLAAGAPIPFAPATARIFVRFVDFGGVSHGSTSVAVQAQ